MPANVKVPTILRTYTGGLSTTVQDGDTVVILPAVAGGAPFAPADGALPGNAH